MSVVPHADAVAGPRAVVVEDEDAVVAGPAVLGARRAVHVARVAVLVRHRRVRLLVPRRLHVLVRGVPRDDPRLHHGGDKEEGDGRGV